MSKSAKIAKRPGRVPEVGPAQTHEMLGLAAKNNGLLSPEMVIEAAKSEDSSLHSRFEWDDGIAAEKYRLVQARMLIHVAVQYVQVENKSYPTRVFVSLSSDRYRRKEGGYRALVDVMADSDLRNQLVMDAAQAMENFQERFKQLKELTKVFSVMNETKQDLLKSGSRRSSKK